MELAVTGEDRSLSIQSARVRASTIQFGGFVLMASGGEVLDAYGMLYFNRHERVSHRQNTRSGRNAGNLLARRLHKCIATAAKNGVFWIASSCRRQIQRFLETKESESRLRDEYCALEGSRTRDSAESG